MRVRDLLSIVAMSVALGGGMPSVAQTDHAADTIAIKKLGGDWQKAWNRRDAAGLSAIFAPDMVAFVSVLGPDTPGFGRGGRAGFEKANDWMLHHQFAKSKVTVTSVDILRFLRPDIAIAHVLWSSTGDRVRHVKFGAPRRGIFTWVLEKQAGQWRVVASQNTEAMPALPSQDIPLPPRP